MTLPCSTSLRAPRAPWADSGWMLAYAELRGTPMSPTYLSPGERRVLDTLLVESRRLDWCAGRLAAKRALAPWVATSDMSRIEVRSDRGRAPRAVLREGSAERSIAASLSITHRDGRAVAAVARRSDRIGVDIERRDAVGSRDLRYFLSSRERLQAWSAEPAIRWALKEAAWKALECDETLPLSELELLMPRGVRHAATDRIDVARLSVRVRGISFAASAHVAGSWPGYVLAVCHIAEAG